MLEFFANYPLGHYLRSMARNPKGAPKIGLYLTRDASMMLLRNHKERMFWNGSLKEFGGAPGLDITEERKEKSNQLPTPYRREVYRRLNLNKGNELHLVVEDHEAYTSSYSVSNYETAEDLLEALTRAPSSIITAWKNYTTNNEYLWEVLSPKMRPLRGNARLPRKVLLCGFPAVRAYSTAKWAEENNQELANIIPATAAILEWGCTHGPEDGFFLLISTTTEIATVYIEKGEMKIFTGQRTKEGFTADEVSDLNDLTEETGGGREAIIWCWGILPGSSTHTRLAGRYKNLRTVTPEELRTTLPLEIKENESPVQNIEAWLLDPLLEP